MSLSKRAGLQDREGKGWPSPGKKQSANGIGAAARKSNLDIHREEMLGWGVRRGSVARVGRRLVEVSRIFLELQL